MKCRPPRINVTCVMRCQQSDPIAAATAAALAPLGAALFSCAGTGGVLTCFWRGPLCL